MKLKTIPFLLVTLIFVFSLTCTQVPDQPPAEEITEEVPKETPPTEEANHKIEAVAEPIEHIQLPEPVPEEGYGNTAGRIFWNSQPVEGAAVLLCERFNIFSGCEGQKYETASDGKGIYLIENISPGDYALLVKLPGEQNYLYAGNILEGATKISITEGRTITVDNIHAYKTDLKLTHPQQKQEIDNRRPVLEWETYQNASYYCIYLAPEAGDIGKLTNQETPDTSYALTEDLPSCNFTWQVEAFNRYGRKIAESDYCHFFLKADCPSCYLKLITPADREKIKQGTTINLTWEMHPIADRYNLSVNNTVSGEYIVNFAKVDATDYEIAESLPEGEYYWGVFVVDSTGRNVAYGAACFEIIK